MNNLGNPELKAIGYNVSRFEISGQEYDGKRRWVGADMTIEVHPMGSFLLNIVTKDHFANENLRDTFAGLDHPEEVLEELPSTELRPPYVLNDEEITWEILKRKFENRRVEADLAASLWQMPEYESDEGLEQHEI